MTGMGSRRRGLCDWKLPQAHTPRLLLLQTVAMAACLALAVRCDLGRSGRSRRSGQRGSTAPEPLCLLRSAEAALRLGNLAELQDIAESPTAWVLQEEGEGAGAAAGAGRGRGRVARPPSFSKQGPAQSLWWRGPGCLRLNILKSCCARDAAERDQHKACSCCCHGALCRRGREGVGWRRRQGRRRPRALPRARRTGFQPRRQGAQLAKVWVESASSNMARPAARAAAAIVGVAVVRARRGGRARALADPNPPRCWPDPCRAPMMPCSS
jgi:hypothetical protein